MLLSVAWPKDFKFLDLAVLPVILMAILEEAGILPNFEIVVTYYKSCVFDCSIPSAIGLFDFIKVD